MRVIRPTGGTSWTRTFTERVRSLTPALSDLGDAGFVVALVMLALVGFGSSFDSNQFLLVGLAGVLLGVALAHLTVMLRWHWLTLAPLLAAGYFGLAGALCLRDDLIAGFVPSLTTLGELARLVVEGWKDLLTTLPPVQGDSPFLVLPYLLALLAGGIGYLVSRRSRAPWLAAITPVVLLGLVIVLGTARPVAALAQGLGFALLSFCWVAWRTARRGRVQGVKRFTSTRFIGGVLLLAVAVGGSALAGGVIPGTGGVPRFVLRTYVEPPLDMNQYPSPLVGFRKYSSQTMKMMWDQELLRVDGVRPGSLLRFTVLDDYSGMSWSASGGQTDRAVGFQRIGSEIPNPPRGEAVPATVTVLPAYANSIDLNAWVPALGPATEIRFEGPETRSHVGSLRYNLSTGQTLTPDRLKAGDVVRITSVSLPTNAGVNPTPSGAPVIEETKMSFVVPQLQKYTAKEIEPWGRLMAVARAMKLGSWSDGTRPGEAQYLPGHSQFRLGRFLNAQQLVGSDEQYAATFALMANELGYPARVVFGAAVPADGLVKGKNVTAWVEVRVNEGSWITIAPSTFIPTRDRRPDDVPPDPMENSSAVVVPPPNPARPPGSSDSLHDSDPASDKIDNSPASQFWRILLMILGYVGPPLAVLAAFVALVTGSKAWRRRRRRTRGSPSTRVAAGWLEILDQARDLGLATAFPGTRTEQSNLFKRADVSELARSADRAVFGSGDPSEEQINGYWDRVDQARSAMLAAVGPFKRRVAQLNLRSLLPWRSQPGRPNRPGKGRR